MTKEQVPKEKIRKEMGRDMTRKPRCIGQGGCVGGEFIWKIEERRKDDMKSGRRESEIWSRGGGGVDPRSDAVEIGWINSVREGWRFKQDSGLAPGE